MALCAEVIDTLWLHLETAPKLLSLLCENLERDVIEQKIADQLRARLRMRSRRSPISFAAPLLSGYCQGPSSLPC
jgi:hypothetical protein